MRAGPIALMWFAALAPVACSTTEASSGTAATTTSSAAATTAATTTTTTEPSGPRAERPAAVAEIVVIGDSITVGATPSLEEQLALAGYPVTILAQEGKRMDADPGGNTSGTDLATSLASEPDPELAADPAERLWVVALGTNDIGNSTEVDDIVAVVDEVLEPIPDDAPLIWIDTWIAHRAEGSELMNAAIERALDERGNATVGRWSELATDPGVLSGDGVHPSDRGSIEFATLVAETVEDFVGA
ncbi:GDSL-type esterase/lipase family protein [Ilumatobacter sp.]|uniref:GDSL-type esterase/lipase family protein n=1 Tax=Ilumatobacter sp. TaxID=1967498 RepID=UPI003B527A07